MTAIAPIHGSARQADLEKEIDRLRWQCRRGMLELDLLLNRFVESAYADLTVQQRIGFVRLLGYQDQIIYDWLMSQAVPADPATRDLVVRIQVAMQPQRTGLGPASSNLDGRD